MKKILFSLCLILLNVGNLQAQEIQLVYPLKAPLSTSLPPMESAVFHLINQHRVANSLKPLLWSSMPAHLARRHSLDMAAGLVPFGHDGADARYAALLIAIPSMTSFGENVAYNFGYRNPAEIAVNGWLASPGHYANIMGDFNLAGVGVATNPKGEYYFTQIFVKANLTSTSLEYTEEKSFSGETARISDTPINCSLD